MAVIYLTVIIYIYIIVKYYINKKEKNIMNKNIKIAKQLINCAQSLMTDENIKAPEYEEVQEELFPSIQEFEPDFMDKIKNIQNMLPPPFLDGTITVKIEYNKTTDFDQNNLRKDNIGHVLIQLTRKQPFYEIDSFRKNFNQAKRNADKILKAMNNIGLTDRKILVVFKYFVYILLYVNVIKLKRGC